MNTGKRIIAMLAILASACLFQIHLASAAATGNETDTPRLWEVTSHNADGPQGKFYLLAISHLGVDVEYDGYLDEKVVPAFLQSDALEFENVDTSSLLTKGCPTPWPDTKENAQLMQMARGRVYSLMEKAVFASPGQSDRPDKKDIEIALKRHADSMPEYGLIIYLYEYERQFMPLLGLPLGRGQVTNYLIKKNEKIKTESIDTPEEWLAAYCQMNQYRPEYFRKRIADPRFDQVPSMTQKDVDDASRNFSLTVNNRVPTGEIYLSFTKSDEEEKANVCGRNNNWLPKMEANMQKGVYFYAVGAAHFFPGTTGNAHCQGLLNDLQAKGMTVRLIP